MDIDKKEYWSQVIDEQKASHLNITQFCREKHIGKNTFYKWLHKLNIPVPQENNIKKHEKQPCFLPLLVSEPAEDIQVSRITQNDKIFIRKMGFEVVVTKETNQDLLLSVLTVLQTL